jgi:hypothetical protein
MISLPRPFWDHQPLGPAAAAHFLRVGGQALLFDACAQQIFQLNDSSEAIWMAVDAARTIAGAAGLLAEGDAAVLEHVRSAVAQWLELGLLRPAAPAAGAERPRQVRLAWMGRRLGLNLSGAVDERPLQEVFAAFRSTEAPDHVLDVRGLGGLVFISDPEGAGCARSPDAWIPEVKARLTTLILRTTTAGFMLHAALLSRGGRGLLICGDSGAGKTTLSVSLLTAGFDYHADDVVWIGEDGRAAGAPFAPAIKAGGWPLLTEMGVQAPTSATYLRGDGQQVRYLLPPAPAAQGALRIGGILLLARGAGGDARIEAAAPLEVLTQVLSSAYAASGAISAAGLKSLAGLVEAARIGRLCFADWRDGRRLVEAFAA